MQLIALMCAAVLALCSVSHADEAQEAAAVLPEDAQAPGALPEDLQAAIDVFYAAIELGDVEARIGLLADDVLLVPNHWTMTRGKEAVAAIFRSGAGAVFKLRDREMVRAVVSGDMAYTANSYFYTYHPEGGSPQWHKTKNIHLWRCVPTGDWRLEVDIWNSDVPIAAFGEE